MQAATEGRKRPCGQVSLCELRQWEKNVRVDKLACAGRGSVGHVSEKKNVHMDKLAWVGRDWG